MNATNIVTAVPISRVFVALGADRPSRGLENIDCSGAIRVTALFRVEALRFSLQTQVRT